MGVEPSVCSRFTIRKGSPRSIGERAPRTRNLECREAEPAMLAWTLRTLTLSLLVCGALALVLAPDGFVDRYLMPQLPARPGSARTATLHAASAPNENIYRRARDGHFYVDADVNGARIRFLVDTGATYVALTADDAKKLGFDLTKLNWNKPMQTANGISRNAEVTLGDIRLNRIVEYNVQAIVMRQNGISLLGMSFLSRLRSWQISNGVLTIAS